MCAGSKSNKGKLNFPWGIWGWIKSATLSFNQPLKNFNCVDSQSQGK